MNKSIFNRSKCLGMLAMLLMSFSSCKEEVDMNFELRCSSDLLELTEPTAKFIDEKGDAQSIVLDASKWEDAEGGIKVWKRNLHFDSYGVSREMAISYTIKNGVEMTRESNSLLHNLICLVGIDGKVKRKVAQGSYENLTMQQVSQSEIDNYMNGLAATTDRCSVVVDEKGSVHSSQTSGN